MTYPDGTIANGTIPASSIKMNPDGTFSLNLQAASVSGKFNTKEPVAELLTPTDDPNVYNVSYSFVDAKTGHLIKVEGTLSNGVYDLTYTDTVTGDTGQATYVRTADGVDYFSTAETSQQVTPPTSGAQASPTKPSDMTTGTSVMPQPVATISQGTLPDTGETGAQGVMLTGAAAVVAALYMTGKRRKKAETESEDLQE